MDRVICIAVDVTGSDDFLYEKIVGCINACKSNEDIRIILLGDSDRIRTEMVAYEVYSDRIRTIAVTEEISEADAPVQAFRAKKNSALVQGLTLVKDGKAGAFLSCVSPRLLNAGAQMILGRIERLSSAPMATLIPCFSKPVLLLDSGSMGSNIKPSDMVLFARMGSLYMRYLSSAQRPAVGLLSESVVPENGGMLYRDSYELLKRCREIEFAGTVKPEEINRGKADVVVCDGFSGGLILNLFAGLVKDLAPVGTIKRKHLFFGKSKEQTEDVQVSSIDLSTRGMTFFPGLSGNVMSICDNPYRETVQKAVGCAASLVGEDIKGRLISFLRL